MMCRYERWVTFDAVEAERGAGCGGPPVSLIRINLLDTPRLSP
jgi:hypothetical protein